MDAFHRAALSGEQGHENFDDTDAKALFHRINESWEEEYAGQADDSKMEEDVPADFLTGRRAYIFQMFYRVLVLHEDEARVIERRE